MQLLCSVLGQMIAPLVFHPSSTIEAAGEQN
jgi:hypothetical protein